MTPRAFILATLLSSGCLVPAYAETDTETNSETNTATVALIPEGEICEEMIGTWFSDFSYVDEFKGKTRYLLRIDRQPNGTAYTKGVSIYYDAEKVIVWEFPSTWSGDGKQYFEEHESGTTKYEIKEFKNGVNVLLDVNGYFDTSAPAEIFEKRKLNALSSPNVPDNVKQFFELEE